MSALNVFFAFLKLGFTSFGGPVAHIGYFRQEFVEKRKWLDEASYADLIALCNFLPGPASSQLGIALGISQSGLLGGIAAWLGFTMPSALALVAFAYGFRELGLTADAGWLHGLKVVAVAVIAQAIWGMGKTLCPDRFRASLAIAATLIVLAWPTALGVGYRKAELRRRLFGIAFRFFNEYSRNPYRSVRTSKADAQRSQPPARARNTRSPASRDYCSSLILAVLMIFA